MKKIFNKNTVLGLIVGIIISGVTVYAVTYNANQITYKDTTVEQALDYLYSKKNYKSGEIFLLDGKNDYILNHNYDKGYTAKVERNNLDFSDILSFTYSYTVSANNSSDQFVILSNEDESVKYLYETSSKTGTVNVNGEKNLKFKINLSYSGTATFKITSYTTKDGKTFNFD